MNSSPHPAPWTGAPAITWSVSQLKDLVARSPDATVLLDANGRIVSTNAEAERLLGRPSCELTGHALGSEALGPSTTERVDLRAQALDGEVRVVCLRERREPGDLVEPLRRAREEIASLGEEMQALTRAVSHDVVAPLQGIVRTATRLAGRYGASLDETGRLYLTYLAESAQQTMEQVSALVALANVQNNELRLERVDLSALVQGIGDRLQAAHPEKKVELVVEPGVNVVGDRDLLVLALEHLLDNAWKFSRPRALPRIDFRVRHDEGRSVYSISDNGVGFDQSQAGRLFRLFHRLHRPEEFPGRGVGLAIVRRVVHRLGGRIWAEASPTGGARFCFSIAS